MVSPLARRLLLGCLLATACCASAGEVKLVASIPYKIGDALSTYERERCRLDVYQPLDGPPGAVLVWFHGGGLTAGNKNGGDTIAVARSLAATGLVVVVPNYRLSPQAKYPAYLEDAAAAVAWARTHAAEHGGDPARLFVGGHSAGGYLTLMLGLDPHYLRDVGVEPAALKGLIPVSGQVVTHFTVRAERGLKSNTITVDEAAPLFYARRDTPPFLVLYADHEMTARAEENAYFVAVMKGAGHRHITGRQLADRDHGSVCSKLARADDPGRALLLQFIADPMANR